MQKSKKRRKIAPREDQWVKAASRPIRKERQTNRLHLPTEVDHYHIIIVIMETDRQTGCILEWLYLSLYVITTIFTIRRSAF